MLWYEVFKKEPERFCNSVGVLNMEDVGFFRTTCIILYLSAADYFPGANIFNSMPCDLSERRIPFALGNQGIQM